MSSVERGYSNQVRGLRLSSNKLSSKYISISSQTARLYLIVIRPNSIKKTYYRINNMHVDARADAEAENAVSGCKFETGLLIGTSRSRLRFKAVMIIRIKSMNSPGYIAVFE